ncbi:MAG: hypothetical protein K2H89_01535, partial [Oscillospiraceae bacterium]|nr:hypothetical protein [Oscillospiraceae bacterium]
MKSSLRKILSGILCTAFLFSSMPVSQNYTATASDKLVQVAIDQKTLTLDELEALNYQVPVFVRTDLSGGLNAVEFGIRVDDQCSCSVINSHTQAEKLAGESLDIHMTYATNAENGNFTWATWASDRDNTTMNRLLLLMVDVPKTVSGGEKFDIRYQTTGINPTRVYSHLWKNSEKFDYVAADEVDYTDGYIEILEPEQTTDPENEELVIPIDALNMGESVKITLHGQPGQSFNGTFDFSESDIENGINDDFNAPAEQLDENGEYEFVLEAPWNMNAFTLHISYTGEPITYTMQYSWEENQEKNLSIPVKELSRGNTVFVVLTGEANQAFQPSFEFSEADLNMGIGGLVSTKEMTLDENGRFEFKFTAPWAMDPFAFNIAYRGSDISYEISYDLPEEPSTTTATTSTTTTTTSTSTTTTTSTTTSTSTTTTTSTTTSTSTTATTSTTAPQTPTQTKTFVDGEDNWSFSNSSNNFPKGYYIKEDYLEKLMDGLTNTEKVSIQDLLSGYWVGSCYGMAATSILAANDILNPSLWQADAQVLYDIKAPISDDTTSLINYYFALQATDFVQQEVCKNFYNGNEGEKIQQLLDCLEDDSPVLLCYHGYFYGNRLNWGGHAVVAYDVEQDGYTVDGEYFDTKIVIYDNNAIDYNPNYCMYINTADNTWVIPAYDLDSRYKSKLGLITDDLNIVNYHGYIDNDGEAGKSFGSYIATMDSNVVKSPFSVQKISLDEDGYTINAGADDEIKMFSSLGDVSDEENIAKDLKFAMLDSQAGYMMSLEELEPQDLNIRYENSLLHAKSSNSDTILF